MAAEFPTHHYGMGVRSSGPDAPLELIEFDLPELKDDDITVNIVYSGMCSSDMHTIYGEWGNVDEQIIPGHEIIGKVARVGPGVTKFAIGDWVGVGPQRDSCRDCKWCNKGEESCCAGFQGLYDKEHTGGYATAVQAPERLVFALPEELTSNEEALKVMAPLLCAGVTTFAPLARHVGSSEPCKVGVVGIGGLGHLGVQFAKALGHTVVAISRSRNKEALAKELGADEVLPFDEPEAVKAATGTFDFVLCTASHKYDLAGYLNLLKARGTMCVVGAPALDDALTFRPQSLIFGEKSLVGSLIGGVESMTSMLNTAAKFSILPMSQMRKFEDANAAMHDLRDGKPRFRYVLDVEGFKKEKGLDAAYMVL